MSAETATARSGKFARSLGGFGGSVAVNGLVSLAVVPIVIAAVGAQLWAGVAIAQSIGSFIGVIVSFGWAVTGPAAVAGLSAAQRGPYFLDSVGSRIWLGIAAAPVLIALVLLFAPGDRLANVFSAAALGLPALGASWFFVGERSPRRLLLWDTLPRALGTATGASLLIATSAPLEIFSGGQALGATAAVVLGWLSVSRRHEGRLHLNFLTDLRRLRGQSDGMVTAVTAALYVNLPVVLAGVVVPQQAALYAVADKLQKLALTALGPVFQVSQGMVGGAVGVERAERARTVGRVAVGFGIVVAVAFAVLGPVGADLLSGGRIDPPLPVVIALGIALGAISISAMVGLSCLTALGAVRAVAMSTVLGALVGIPAIVIAGTSFGISGIAIAAALSEVIVTVYQLVVLRRRLGESLHPKAVPPLLGSPTF